VSTSQEVSTVPHTARQSHSPAPPGQNTWETCVPRRLSPLPALDNATLQHGFTVQPLSLEGLGSFKRRRAYRSCFSLVFVCALADGTLRCYREIGVLVVSKLQVGGRRLLRWESQDLVVAKRQNTRM
jgi:hypothetical protein